MQIVPWIQKLMGAWRQGRSRSSSGSYREQLVPSLFVRQLEERRVLSSTPLAWDHGADEITLDGGPQADDGMADVFRVSRQGDEVEVSVNGRPVYTAPLADLPNLTVDGSGDDDTLIVDFSGGNPLAAGDILFNGRGHSEGGGDCLRIDRGSFGGPIDTLTHRSQRVGDGLIQVATNARDTAYGPCTIAYTGIESVHDASLADRLVFQFTSAGETVAIRDDGQRGDGESTISSSLGTPVTFAGPKDSLSVQAASADPGDADTITVEGLDDQFAAGLTIRADANDTVDFTGPVDLAGKDLDVSGGLLQVDQTITSGGATVHLDAGARGTLLVSGTIDVSRAAAGQTGGTVHLLGDRVGLVDGAQIDASGHAGGGTVLVGGDFQGISPSLRNASRAFVGPHAAITASAMVAGDGGTVVVWADDLTRCFGGITARAGTDAGNGGLIETSGKDHLEIIGARIDAGAPAGIPGVWLLDPHNVTIRDATTAGGDFSGEDLNVFTPIADDAVADRNTIQDSLDNGTSVTIKTGTTGTQDGDITVADKITKSDGGVATLTLDAAADIFINADISSTAGALNVDLNADVESPSGGNVFINAAIATNGGTFDSDGVGFDSTGGTIIVGPATATINHTGTVALGTVTVGGALQVTAGGTVTQAAPLSASSLTVKTLNDAGADITLEHAGNSATTIDLRARDSADAVDAAGDVSYRDSGGFSVATIRTTGDVTLNSAGAIIDGNAEANNVTATRLALTAAGEIGSSNDPLDTTVDGLAAQTTLSGGVFVADADAVEIAQIGTLSGVSTAGDGAIHIKATNDTLTVSQAVATGGAGNVTLDAGTAGLDLQPNGTVTAGTGKITLTSDTIALTADLSGSGELLLQPATPDRNITLAGSGDGYQLDATELGHIRDGFAKITIGRENGTGGINLGAVTFNDPVELQSPGGGTINVDGPLTGAGDASILLDGSGATTVLSAGITTAGNSITFSDNVQIDAAITLDTTDGGNSPAGANVQFDGTVETDGTSHNLTITAGNGDVAFTGAVGAANNPGVLAVTSAGNVEFGSTLRANDVALTGTEVRLAGDATALTDDVAILADLQLRGNVTVTTGTGAGDDFTVSGRTDADSAASNRTLGVAAGDGDVSFAGAVGGGQALASFTVVSANDVSLRDVTTQGDPGHAILITAGNDLTLAGTLSTAGGSAGADTGNIRLGVAGQIILDADATLTTDDGGTGTDGTVTVDASQVRSNPPHLFGLTVDVGQTDTDFDASALTLTDLDHLRIRAAAATLGATSVDDGSGNGNIAIDVAAATINLTGDLTTNSQNAAAGTGAVLLDGAVVLQADVAIHTENTNPAQGDGGVTISGTVDADAAINDRSLRIDANDGTGSAGSVQISAAVGSGQSLAGGLTIDAAAIQTAAVSTDAGDVDDDAGAIALDATDTVTIGGPITAVGSGTGSGGTVRVDASGTNAVSVQAIDASGGGAGAAAGGNITLNDAGGTGTVTLAGHLTTVGAAAAGGNVTVGTAALIGTDTLVIRTGATGGNVAFDGTVDSSGTPRTLDVQAGTGNVTFDGDIGAAAALSGLAVQDAAAVALRSVVTNGPAGIVIGSSSAVVRVDARGTLDSTDGDAATDAGPITLSSDDVDLLGDLTVDADDDGGTDGTITLGATAATRIDASLAGSRLSIRSGSAAATLRGDVGSSARVGGLDVDSTGGTLAIHGDLFTQGGHVDFSGVTGGSIDVTGNDDADFVIDTEDGTGDTAAGDVEFSDATFLAGAITLTLDATDGGGAVDADGDVTLPGSISAAARVDVDAERIIAGSIVTAGGDVDLRATAASGEAITFGGETLDTTAGGLAAAGQLLLVSAGGRLLLDNGGGPVTFRTDGNAAGDRPITINAPLDANAAEPLTLLAGTGPAARVDLNAALGRNGQLGLLTIDAREIHFDAHVDAAGITATAQAAIRFGSGDGSGLTDPTVDSHGSDVTLTSLLFDADPAATIRSTGGTDDRALLRPFADDQTVGIGDAATTADVDVTENMIRAVDNSLAEIAIGLADTNQTGGISIDDTGGLTGVNTTLRLRAGGAGAEVNLHGDVTIINPGSHFLIDGSGATTNVRNTLRVQTDAGNIHIPDGLLLSDGTTLTLDTQAGGGNVTVDGSIHGNGGANEHLVVTAGSGKVTLGDSADDEIGDLTATSRFGAVTIATTGDVALSASVYGAALAKFGSGGTTAFGGPLDLDGALVGDALRVEAETVTFADAASVTLRAGAGHVNIDGTGAGRMTVGTGGFDLTAAPGAMWDVDDQFTSVELASAVRTRGGPIFIGSGLTLIENVTLDTTNGAPSGAAITLATVTAETASSAETLTLDAGTQGDIAVGGPVGANRLGLLTVRHAADVEFESTLAVSGLTVAESNTFRAAGRIDTTGAAVTIAADDANATGTSVWLAGGAELHGQGMGLTVASDVVFGAAVASTGATGQNVLIEGAAAGTSFRLGDDGTADVEITEASLAFVDGSLDAIVIGDTTDQTGSITIDDGSEDDLLTLRTGLTLRQLPGGTGEINLASSVTTGGGDFTVDGSRGSLNVDGSGGGTVTISSGGGDVVIHDTITFANDGDDLTILSGGGRVQLLGSVAAHAASPRGEDIRIAADGGDVTLGRPGDAFGGTAAAGSRLGLISVESTGDVTVHAKLVAGAYVQQAGGATLQFNAPLDLDNGAPGDMLSLTDVTGARFADAASVTTDHGGAASLDGNGTGTLTIGTGAWSLDGAFSQRQFTSVSLGADITTTDDDVTFADPVTLSDGLVIDSTGAAAGSILFGSTVAAGANDLTLDAGGAGNVTLQDAFAGGTLLVRDGAVQSYRAITADRLTVENSATGVTFDGVLQIAGAVDINTAMLTLNAPLSTTNSGAVTVTNTALADLNARITAAGSVRFDGSGPLSLDADVQTTDANSQIRVDASVLTLSADRSLTTNHGDITLDEVRTDSHGDHVLTLSAGAGNVLVDDNVGVNGGNVLGGLIVQSAGGVRFSTPEATVDVGRLRVGNTTPVEGHTEFAAAVNVAGPVDVNTARLTLGGTVTTTNGGTVTVTNTAQADLGAKITAAGSVRFDGSGAINLDADVETTDAGSQIQVDAATVTLHRGCSLMTRDGHITLDEVLTTNGSHGLTLAAGTGAVTFNDNVGQEGMELGPLHVANAGPVDFSGAAATVDAARLLIGSTATPVAGVTFDGALGIDGPIDVASSTTILQNGAVTNGTDLNYSSGDTISLNAGIAVAGRITFNPGAGGVNQTAAAVTGNELLLSGAGTFALDRPGNDFGTVAANVLGPLTLRDANDLTVGTIGLAAGIATGDAGTPGADVIVNTGGILTVSEVISTETPGSGGAKGAAHVGGGVVLAVQNALNVGAGNIRLRGGADDLLITLDQESDATLNLGAPRHVMIHALVRTTPGSAADIHLTADDDEDGSGSVQIDAGGRLDSSRNLVLRGAAVYLLSDLTAAGESILRAADGSITLHDPVILTENVQLSTHTASGNLDFLGTVDGSHRLTLQVGGATTFRAVVGGAAPVGDGQGAALQVNSIGPTVFEQAVTTRSGIAQPDAAGEITFRGDVTVEQGDTGSLFNADVTLDGLTFTSHGGLGVVFGNDVATDRLTLAGDAVSIAVNTGDQGDEGLTVRATVDGPQDLTLAVDGTSQFHGPIGATAAIGDAAGAALTIHSSGPTVFQQAVTTESGIWQDDAAGQITFRGDVTIDDLRTPGLVGDTGSLFNADVTLDGLNFTSHGGLDVAFGNDAAADRLTLSGDAVMIAVNTGNRGDEGLTVEATVDGPHDLTLAVDGTSEFHGPIGAAAAIGDATGAALTVHSSGPTVFQQAVTTESGIWQDEAAGEITFRGDVTIDDPRTPGLVGDTGSLFNADVTLDGLNFTSHGGLDVAFGNDAAADRLTLSGEVVLIDVDTGDRGDESLTVEAMVDGPHDLILSVDGTSEFHGAIGAAAAIGDAAGPALRVSSTGPTDFKETLVTGSGIWQFDSAGQITFRRDVVIGAGNTNSIFYAGLTLDGLTLTSAGAVMLGNQTADQVMFSGGPVRVQTTGARSTLFVNATVHGDQDLTLGSGEDVLVNASIRTAGGLVRVLADDDVALSRSMQISSEGGDVWVQADADGSGGGIGGALTMADGAVIDAGTGEIVLAADENVTLASLQTTNPSDQAVTITSTSGGLVDAGDTALDILANGSTVVIRTAAGVGSHDAIDTQIATLDLENSTSGNVAINEADALSIRRLFQHGAGTVNVDAAGTITVEAGQHGVSATSGWIELDANRHPQPQLNGQGALHANGQGEPGANGPDPSIAVNATIRTGSGEIRVLADHDVTFAPSGRIISSSGAVAVTADAEGVRDGGSGALTMAGGSLIDAGSGTVTLLADQDVTLARVQTTSTSDTAITVTSTSGGVLAGGDPALNLVARGGTAVIRAVAGVGPANPIHTQIAALDLDNSLSGDVAISQTGALSVHRLTQRGAGGVHLEASGTITVAAGRDGVSATSGRVELHANGGDSSIAVDARIQTAGGNIQLRADHDATLDAGGRIASAGGAVTVTADADGGLDGGSGALTMADGSSIAAAAGAVALAADQDVTLAGVQTTDALAVHSSSGAIGDTPNAQIAVGGAAVFQAASGIVLGDHGAADTTDFGSVELIGGIVVLAEDSSTLLVAADLDTLELTSAGNIVTGRRLDGSPSDRAVRAQGTLDLNAAGNLVVHDVPSLAPGQSEVVASEITANAGGRIRIENGAVLESTETPVGKVTNAPPLLRIDNLQPVEPLGQSNQTQALDGTLGGIPETYVGDNLEQGANFTITVVWDDGVENTISGVDAGQNVELAVAADGSGNPEITDGDNTPYIELTITREYPLAYLFTVNDVVTATVYVRNDEGIRLSDGSGVELNEASAEVLTEVVDPPRPVDQPALEFVERAVVPVNEPTFVPEVRTVPQTQARYEEIRPRRERVAEEGRKLYIVKVGPDGQEEEQHELPEEDLNDLSGLFDKFKQQGLPNGQYRIYIEERGFPPRMLREFLKSNGSFSEPVREPPRGSKPTTDESSYVPPGHQFAAGQPEARQAALAWERGAAPHQPKLLPAAAPDPAGPGVEPGGRAATPPAPPETQGNAAGDQDSPDVSESVHPSTRPLLGAATLTGIGWAACRARGGWQESIDRVMEESDEKSLAKAARLCRRFRRQSSPAGDARRRLWFLPFDD